MGIFQDTPWKAGFDELHQGAYIGFPLWREAHLGYQGVALAKLTLEVLNTAQASELTIDHDGQSCTQSLTFFHAENRFNVLSTENAEPFININI